ncbi:MAG: hypothetical protein A2V79_02740 [Betaproteobacteria bacterium RBG_16_56_24]|nr:MAG: hypothetical protein A2V79_02740 [Betaproteobacteria bacterium RBG_16_56_24]
MDKRIIWGVIALTVASISVLLMLPDSAKHSPGTLPWNIAHPTPGTSLVFGITLGQSPLNELERVFHEQAAVSLFKTGDGKLLIEAFFDELNLNGLKAKFVLTIAVPPEEMEGIFNRGLRMNSTPSGKRITLTADDLARIRQAPVASLTYLPNVRLEEDIIAKRFGEPAQRVRENKTNVIHWLYPQHGLDIALGGKEKPLLQYVAPKDFELLRAPLLASGEILK